MGWKEGVKQLLLIVIPGLMLALINVFGSKERR